MSGGAAAATLPSSPRVSADADRRAEPREIRITPEKLAESMSKLYGVPITTKTLANWRSAGKGPSFMKLGRTVTYSLREVNRWFETQRRNSHRVEE